MLLLSLLLACGGSDLADPVSLDDACGTDAYGYDSPTDDARAALERTHCYRNLMGLDPGLLDPQLDEAAQAHAEYMDTNHTIDHQERSSNPGFTGEWPWDRVEAAGYRWYGGIMEVLAMSTELTPAGAVDTWMDSVYHRVPFLIGSWTAAGYGQSGNYGGMVMNYPFPSDTDEAVIFPVDGQVDVPTSFDSDTESPDPAPGIRLVGYPVMVGVDATGYSMASSTDPFELRLVEATLTGPDGDVDALLLDPSNDDWLVCAVALVPTEPLAPASLYEVDLTVTWTGGNERRIQSSFTTAEP